MFYVYVIFYKNGVPCYVGKGSGLRWQIHARRTHNKQLRGVFRKAIKELPVTLIRENIDENIAFEIERALIKVLGRKDLGTGCLLNHIDGGEGPSGLVHTQKTKDKLSLAKTGIKLGPRSEEVRQKIGAGNKGKVRSAEIKAKLSLAAQNRSPEARKRMSDCRIGKTHSAETRLKMSRTRKGMVKSAEHLAALSRSLKGKKRGPSSAEHKAKQSAALKGKPWSAARRAAQ